MDRERVCQSGAEAAGGRFVFTTGAADRIHRGQQADQYGGAAARGGGGAGDGGSEARGARSATGSSGARRGAWGRARRGGVNPAKNSNRSSGGRGPGNSHVHDFGEDRLQPVRSGRQDASRS